ncbi:MAG: glycosyltransferase family 4 protein [Sedimentisphaerales bacterium]|nr:glycosyltransferase family 4 protein [Sedimentisphaerales bacterium]
MNGKRVLLLHAGIVQHYRVPIYNYFAKRFEEDNISFLIACESIQSDHLSLCNVTSHKINMNLWSWLAVVRKVRPEVVILFTGIHNYFVFPFILAMQFLNIKVIYWGHGINLTHKNSWRPVYCLLHRFCHAIILYGDHLRQNIAKRYWRKIFIANNTLCLVQSPPLLSHKVRSMILAKYNIKTEKNIVFTGRMQVRKRIPDLLNAVSIMDNQKVGVILIGPDIENVLPERLPCGVMHIPKLYGNELLELMSACDIYCCPGCVGLNIVDAMACSLPFVTENLENHGPEIMYLKNGENGIRVPAGKVDLLADTLTTLLNDNSRRSQMAKCAIFTYKKEASIERMFNGFLEAVQYVLSFNGQ